jgi:hypothetical protein
MKKTFSMQLIPCQNSLGINMNHRNNMLTLRTGIADVISVFCYSTLVKFMLKQTHIASRLRFVRSTYAQKTK